MAHEQKFFNLAVRESNLPQNSSLEERIHILIMGMIGVSSITREDFSKQAVDFIDEFSENANIAIQKILDARQSDEENNLESMHQDYYNEMIEYVRQLVLEADNVDRSIITHIAAADWDDRVEISNELESEGIDLTEKIDR